MTETISGADSNGSPEAELPEAPDPAWVLDAPLRLLAYALHTMHDRTGKAAEIKAVLQSQVEPSVKWSHWWQQTQEMVAQSDHFKLGSRPTTITLLSEEINDIPSPPLPPPPPPKAQREWLQWFQGEADDVPSKSGNPVKAAHDALNICPPESLGRALRRTRRAARNFLSIEKPAESAAKEWAHLLSNAAQRWRSRPDASDGANSRTAARMAELMAELITVAGFPGESVRWLCQAGVLLDEPHETWRQAFVAGLWDAMSHSNRDFRNWGKSFSLMPQRDREGSARAIALAAFTGGASPVPPARFPVLDALLSYMSDTESAAFLRNLVVLGISGKAHRQSVVNYIAHAHNASHPQKHLDAAVPAFILLTDGHGPVAAQAAQGIAQALDDDNGAGPLSWDALLSESRQRITSQRAALTDQIEELHTAQEKQRLCYENRLAQSDRETARLLSESRQRIASQRAAFTSQIDELRAAEEKQRRCYENRLAQSNAETARLRAEIAAGREESRLDIRQDMLTVISETLYDLRGRQDSPQDLLRLVETRLSLALRAGGAEEFGTIGETAPYDPIQHQSDGEIRPGSPVRIAAPGAVVRGKLTGDRVLVKASVTSLTEDE